MHKLYIVNFFLLIGFVPLFAQPANDECVNAIPLEDVSNWCSERAAFTTVGATASPEEKPFCFPSNQTNNDVWFSFIAGATTLSVSVSGATFGIPAGTLADPQVAVYSGSCGNLTEVECISDAFNNNTVITFAGPLVVGQTYYLRVGARGGARGTFQLCVSNFNEVPQPSADCPTGVILCDKSPFTVSKIVGEGLDPNEIRDVSCNSLTCDFRESSSTWYKWTCDQPGTLTFTLTPLNPADDLDFVVYELPNGVDDCTGKVDIRCMASGENVGQPLSDWIACTGPTGLSTNDNDDSESCGCQPANNNFAAAVNMESGKSYALVVNNFSRSGSGFSIEFGGTGTFLGPTANFSAAPVAACVGEPVTFTDQSSFIGTIVSWDWTFGPGASIPTASTRGPHSVSYNRPGQKSIVLTVGTDGGCVVTRILTINVECCPDHFSSNAGVSNLSCANTINGAIDLNIDSGFPPYLFNWSNGATTEDLNGLQPGPYAVTVTDEAGCQTNLSFTIDSPPPYAFDTLVTMPTCGGGTDGAVQLIVGGGTPPYQYNWNNTGFSGNNTLNGISQGDYPVVVRDQNGCEEQLLLPVRELELILDPTVTLARPPTCFGFSDGFIEVSIANGLGPFRFDWNDGNGYVGENSLQGLPAGAYQVDVLDANLCSGSFAFDLVDHPPLTLGFDPRNISCYGLSDGTITALAAGGVGDYRYSWSGSQSGPNLTGLPAGDYMVTVLDGNDCQIEGSITLTQPNELFIDVVDILDNICNAESKGAVTVAGSGGTGPYEYSIDGQTFQPDPLFEGLPAGTFTFTVVDALGCTETTQGTVSEPVPLVVDAGPDQFIELGFTADIRATASDPFVRFAWSPVEDIIRYLNADSSSLTVRPVNTTTFQVTIMDAAGCKASDLVTIRVIKNRPVYIPNAFSPNGDGANDGFTLYGGPALAGIESLKIFDRWGELLFDATQIAANDESLGWDGTFRGRPVNPGVFVYLAEVRFIDGDVVQFSGDVTLLR